MTQSSHQTETHWIVAHGTLGAPERNWFPWLAWQGLRNGKTVRVPRLPTPHDQSYDSWNDAFVRQAPALGTHVALIGHSTGVPFLLQHLQRTGQKAGRVVLVSGFVGPLDFSAHPELEPLVRTFVDFPFDWEKLRGLATSYHCFHGDDDDLVPLALGQRVADGLGVPLAVIPGGQHLNTEAKRFEFDEILAILA